MLGNSKQFSNKLFRSIKVLKTSCKYSNEPVLKETMNDLEVARVLGHSDKLAKFSAKTRIKQPQKPPFAKNIFVGVFDTDILAYPQLQNKQELDTLESSVAHVEKLCNDVDKEKDVTVRELLHELKTCQALGLQPSQMLGGQELNVSEHCRYNEVLTRFNAKYNILSNEVLGIQTLLKFGTDYQKKKYLDKLIDGTYLAAFGAGESRQDESGLINTKASLSRDKKSWILNGEKTFVVNGGSADVYIVFAQDAGAVKGSKQEIELTAFFVDKDSPGIIIGTCETDSKHQFDLCNVSFNDTSIPIDNLIGYVGGGRVVMSTVLTEYHLSFGPLCANIIKDIMKNLHGYVLNSSTQENELYKLDSTSSKIGQIMANAYILESVTYLTAGLLDGYEKQDCELEAAIVKALSSQLAYDSTTIAFNMIGAPCLLSNHWSNKLHKDAVTQLVLNESIDNLKIIIGLLGIQYAGKMLNEKIKKLRNPFFNAPFILKRMWTERRQADDNPKLILELKNYLHPSCIPSADKLEYCVLRLQYVTEMLLMRHGIEIVNQHSDLQRLSDCITDIYIMTACLGRASRSYCIGLQHAEYEMILANTICKTSVDRFKHNVSEILKGGYSTADKNYRILTKRFFKFKGYFPVHPLSRNY